jgi:SSS family solute:Na+ symporter
LKPLATLNLGGADYVFYVGLGALVLNVVVAAIATVIVAWILPNRRGAIAPT